jgi:hypothetical protein
LSGISLKYRKPPIGAKDAQGDLLTSLIEVERPGVRGELIGHYKKAQYGSGYFLCIYGTKWVNAPGARYPQELDFKADYTYCKTKKQLEDRVRQALRERSQSNSST